jgi:hypothetical protein
LIRSGVYVADIIAGACYHKKKGSLSKSILSGMFNINCYNIYLITSPYPILPILFSLSKFFGDTTLIRNWENQHSTVLLNNEIEEEKYSK